MAELTKHEQYIRDLADLLYLKDWAFRLLDDPLSDDNDEEAAAKIEPIYGQKRANISLCKGFTELEPRLQRRYLLHELIHMHFEGAAVIVRNDLWEGRMLSQGEYNAIWYPFRTQVELAVDGMADAIQEYFPLMEADK